MPAGKKYKPSSKLKRKWRNSSAGKITKGLFGPSRKTIERVKTGLTLRETKKHISLAEAVDLLEKLENKKINASKSMAIKYSLDAINVKNLKKRQQIIAAIKKADRQVSFANMHGKGVPVTTLKEMTRVFVENLGPIKARLFFKIITKKQKNIRIKMTD